MVKRIALDHNFPKPVLASVDRWLRELEFVHIRDLDPYLADLQDHDLIYDLADRGLTLMVTHNWKMENDVRVLVAVIATRSTLLTLRRAGDDMLFATGVLLRDLVPILRKEVPHGQVFRARPSTLQPTRARDLLSRLAQHDDVTADDLIQRHRQQ